MWRQGQLEPFAFLQHETDTGARSDISIHTTIRGTFHPREDKTLV